MNAPVRLLSGAQPTSSTLPRRPFTGQFSGNLIAGLV